jgi:DNA-binding PadR family transcriptional regulator
MSDLTPWLLALALLAALVLVHVLRGVRSRREALIFRALRDGPASGLQVRKAIDPAPGAVMWAYAVLRRLERAGRLSSWEEPGGPERGGYPRRVYSLWPRA